MDDAAMKSPHQEITNLERRVKELQRQLEERTIERDQAHFALVAAVHNMCPMD